MSAVAQAGKQIPRIVLTDPELLRDPFDFYGRAREESPLVRLLALGITPMWGLTRHEDARAMLADPRFVFTAESLRIRPDVPDAGEEYLSLMLLDDGGHKRVRRLVSSAFTPRRAEQFRARLHGVVDGLLDELEGEVGEDGSVDLLRHFAKPLPIDASCEFLGIPQPDRLRWRRYGATANAAEGSSFAEIMPATVEDTKLAIERRRSEPADDVISDLLRAQREDAEALSDVELEALVWNTIMASSTVADFVGNAVLAVLTHPEQLALLREDPSLMPGAVEELIRWSALTLMSIPRYAREDVELFGVVIRAGSPIVAVLASANRDPRVFTDPDRLDVTRPVVSPGHFGFLHGPHTCLGISVARVLCDVALTVLLRRYPALALAVSVEEVRRVPDPGTWRLESLPVTL